MFKYVITILFITFVICNTFTQEVEIQWNEIPGDTLVNMGPCFVEDSLLTSFSVHNQTNNPVYINYISPTIIIQRGVKERIFSEFRQFEQLTIAQESPQEIAPDESREILVSYNPDRLSIAPLGWQEAHFDLGVTSDEQLNNIVNLKRFRLMAKKTRLYLDSYVDSLRFDSVYVNPTTPKTKTIRLKSTFRDNISVVSQAIELLSPKITENEFEVEIYDVDPVFSKKYQIVDWPIRYSPLNRGVDSALFNILFRPLPQQFPDSLDRVPIWVSGIGVEQDLNITNSNFDFRNDTIDIGSVRIGVEVDIYGTLTNDGNTAFGVQSEAVFNSQGEVANSFEIINLLKSANDIPAFATGAFQLRFRPEELGDFLYEYRIESDILSRKIHGVPASKRYERVFIRGVATRPILSFANDTVDFGNIVLNTSDCPSERDTLFTISNIGNEELVIRSIEMIPPQPQSLFRVMPTNIVIPANSDTTIRIVYSSNIENLGESSAKLIFNTNLDPPNDKSELLLIANGLPPVSAVLEIDKEIKAKPGTIIRFPILLHNDGSTAPSSFGRTFHTKLSYDPTILGFRNRVSIGTAFEGADLEITNGEAGVIEINAVNPETFLLSDTLLLLEFDTYLGFRPATEISLSEVQFGDGSCPQILSLSLSNGSFAIDSVCGLDFIAIPIPEAKFNLKILSKNPAESSLRVGFNLPFSTRVQIVLTDIFGSVRKVFLTETFPEGNFESTFSISDLPSGSYFLTMNADIFSKTLQVSISK